MTTRGKLGFRQHALYHATGSFRATLANPNWHAAMEDEFSVLLENSTWDLVPCPPTANLVTGKWIFNHKFKADGSLERYKAQWVLRGFNQCPSIDFDETFSPIVKPATMRTILSCFSQLAHSSARRRECFSSWGFDQDSLLFPACLLDFRTLHILIMLQDPIFFVAVHGQDEEHRR